MYVRQETADGSITYYNEVVGETYHSKSGALEEALKKHVHPSGLLDRESACVLDVCYGLGYNSFVALSLWQDQKKDGTLNFICLENDVGIMQEGISLELPKVLRYAQSFFAECLKHPGVECNANMVLGKIIIDDFRAQIKQLQADSVDIIFFDPFSPGKVPELWTEEIFSDLFVAASSGAVLTTYSCARKVRDALQAAGWVVEDGPVVGRRSPSTIARKV